MGEKKSREGDGFGGEKNSERETDSAENRGEREGKKPRRRERAGAEGETEREGGRSRGSCRAVEIGEGGELGVCEREQVCRGVVSV